MATLAQLQTWLTNVQTSIDTISTQMAQSVSRSGRATMLLQIESLQKREAKLQQMIAAAQGQYQPVGVRFRQVPGAGVTAFDPMHNYLGPRI